MVNLDIPVLIQQEKAKCVACQRGDMPSHFSGYYVNGKFNNNTCESGGRKFDADKGKFVGSAHCTCDTCF